MALAAYPVHVDASLDPSMSRWLWLVKWVLAIPHYIVLFFLWIAFGVVSVLAFFAILFTGRYPAALFEFNVGVLRWSWRVTYYAYGVLGTDRYPPFTLRDVPDYPAHFDVEYPTHLSRGLVLVKWWLLAIPHYVVVGIFLGGGTWALWQTTDARSGGAPGLIGLLVLIAAVVLAVTGRYPQQLFDFVLGMNRWVLRVAAYAALMTDEYPPFRLDMGGHEPGGTMTLAPPPASPPPVAPPPVAPPPVAPPPVAPQPEYPPPPAQQSEFPPAPPPGYPPPPPPPGYPSPATPLPEAAPPAGRAPARGWTAGRVVALVVGAVLALASLGLLAGGGLAAWATNTQRDAAGYLTSDAHVFSTSSYAITSDRIDLGRSGATVTPAGVLGTVRVRVHATRPSDRVFVGVGPRAAVDTYLAGVGRLVVTNWVRGDTRLDESLGAAPLTAPTNAGVWSASTAGRGTQTLTWRPTGGQWVVVVMNAHGGPAVSVTADIGATVPDLAWIAAGLLIAGVVLLVIGVVSIAVSVTRASR